MRTKVIASVLVAGPLLIVPGSRAQEFPAQRARDAVRAAKSFLAGLESPGKCPVSVEADPERAAGVANPPDTLPFFLFVPQKALEKIDFRGEEVRKGYGVPVGYLFVFWVPVVEGRLVERPRMQNTVYQDPKAGRLDFPCLVLTAGRKEEGHGVLHAFGTEKVPLFSVPLEETGKAGTSLEVKDVDVRELRLKLGLSFGGRRASIPFGTPRQPGR